MRLFLLAIIAASMVLPALAYAQEPDYNVIKSQRSESFVFPYTASNRDFDNALVYTYDVPKAPSWILSIRNNMSYVAGENAKTVVRIQEPAPSEKYVELVMYGGESRKYWIAVNTAETGYARMYSQPVNGWSTEGPITVTHNENSGLTVSDGKRIVLDRLDVEGFSVGSIMVYGKDEAGSLANTYAGDISFEIAFGSFSESPVFFVPAAVTVGVGGLIGALLIFKKRKPSG
jgi:hypothetical protein